jgi:hypothetical protein
MIAYMFYLYDMFFVCETAHLYHNGRQFGAGGQAQEGG